MMANISRTPPGALGKAPEDDPWHLADRHGTQELDAFEGTFGGCWMVGWLDGWMVGWLDVVASLQGQPGNGCNHV